MNKMDENTFVLYGKRALRLARSSAGMILNLENGEESFPDTEVEGVINAVAPVPKKNREEATLNCIDALLLLAETYSLEIPWSPEVNPDVEIGETDTGHWECPIRIEKAWPAAHECTELRKFVHGAGCEHKIHTIFVEENPPVPETWITEFLWELVKTINGFMNLLRFGYSPFNRSDIESITSLLAFINNGHKFSMLREDLQEAFLSKSREFNLEFQVLSLERERDAALRKLNSMKTSLRSVQSSKDKTIAEASERISSLTKKVSNLKSQLYSGSRKRTPR